MYILQNSAVALSASSALVASLAGTGGALFWACIVLTIGVGSASSVGCQGSALSVEREWTKALCRGDSGALALLNAGAALCTTFATAPSAGLEAQKNASIYCIPDASCVARLSTELCAKEDV